MAQRTDIAKYNVKKASFERTKHPLIKSSNIKVINIAVRVSSKFIIIQYFGMSVKALFYHKRNTVQ